MRSDRQDWTTMTWQDAALALTLHSQMQQKLVHIRKSLEDHFSLYWLSTNSTSSTSWMFNVDQWRCLSQGFQTLDQSRDLLTEMISISDAQNFGRTLNAFKLRVDSGVDTFSQLDHIDHIEQDESLTKDVDQLCESILIAVQNIYTKYCREEHPTEGTATVEEPDVTEDFEKNHLTSMLLNEMQTDLQKLLKVDSTVFQLSGIMARSSQDGKDAQLISKALPVIDQYIYVIEYYLSLQLATMRTSSKLLSVLLNVFNQLIEKGFCRPSEAEQDNSTGSTMQFQDNESGGLGDGDGGKDVSDQIENEDQLDSAKQQDQEEEEEEENDQSGMKEEENGIEMSEDFKADLQDKDKEEGKSDGESEDDDEQENLDKEMGETGEQADQLDEKLWGSDEEEGDEDEDDQDQEEGQGDAQKMESQMTAKNGDDDDDEGNDDQNSKDNKKQQEPKLDEEDEENVNDDQTDPFHSTHEPPPAPEPLDVPDDLNLDGGDAGGDEDEPNETEEDPFDIDAAKNDDVPMDEQESNEQGDEKAGEEEQEMADESQEPESNQQGEDSTKEPAQESGDDDENEEGKHLLHLLQHLRYIHFPFFFIYLYPIILYFIIPLYPSRYLMLFLLFIFIFELFPHR